LKKNELLFKYKYFYLSPLLTSDVIMNIFILYFCCYLNKPLNSEVPVLNLSQETMLRFSLFFSISPRKCVDTTMNWLSPHPPIYLVIVWTANSISQETVTFLILTCVALSFCGRTFEYLTVWSQVTNGRIEYKKGRHSSDPCILTTLSALFSPYIHASRSTLNKVQYPAARYALKVTWLQEIMTQVPDP